MKKVINITLSNVVFAIEHDAYDTLASYLEQIKSNLNNNEDTKEILDDIECAIAEKLIARKRSEKIAVTSADIASVMEELGSPVEFKDSTASNDEHFGASESESGLKRRFYRDSDDMVIAGVASGLASYLGIDPVIVRLIFVVSVFFNGIGILAYIILWLVVPAAKTTADKYAMRGEQVTLKDISERVKKNIEHIDYGATKGAWAYTRNILDKLFQVLGTAIKFFIVLIRYFVGLALVISGVAGIAVLVSLYGIILFSEKVFFPYEVQMALEILQGSVWGIVAMVSSLIMMTVPLIAISVVGVSMMAKRNFFSVQKTVTLAVVWVVAIVVAGTTSALQVEKVMQRMGLHEREFSDKNVEMNLENGAAQDNDQVYFDYQGQ